MHKENSLSSGATETPGQNSPSKLERALLVSPGFFVLVAGVVFLTRSLDLYSVCDASLMFLIGIGWVIGCRKMARLEGQIADADLEKQQTAMLSLQAEKTFRESEVELASVLRDSPQLLGAVELDGNVVLDIYENAESERFFANVLSESGDQGSRVYRTQIIFTWLKRYQESCWIKKPVQFECECTTEQGSRCLSVAISESGKNSLGQSRFCYVAEDVTDRKKSQRVLAQSQEHLTEILDTYPDAVFFLDSEWQFTYLNAPAIEALGHGREVIGRAFWDVYPELIGTTVWTYYTKAMAERVPAEFDVFHGSERRFQVRAVPCQGGLVVFLRDVTSERQTVETLLDNERQLRRRLAELETLYQTNPMGLALFDNHLRFVRINDTLADLNGVRVEATVGRTLGEVLPSSYELFAPLLTQVIETGRPMYVQFENAKRTEGESWKHCLTNAYPLRDESGTVAGVSLIMQDTTAARQAEQALRESEQRFRQLAEALPEIVWTADANGNIDYCNARWYAYTKCAGDDAISDWSSLIHPSDVANWRELRTRSTAAGEDYEIEYQFLRHDGVYRWFLCRAQAVYNLNGEIVKWFGVCTDIQHHKRIELLLRRSNDDLKQLSAAASNELQEHLRNITSFWQLAQQHRGELTGEAENYLETILAATAPAEPVLQDLPSYSLRSRERQRSVGAR